MFIVGAPKCGTTAWVNYLSSHPDIEFSSKKEPHFFCEDFINFRWARSLEEYQSYFSHVSPRTKIIGEASVMYLYSESAAINIRKYNPDAKIIIILRNYVDFLKSYHQQLLNNLDEDETDFAKAWLKQTTRKQGQDVPRFCRESKFLYYKDVCSFGAQLEKYYDVFPKDQIRVLWLDHWIRDPHKTYLEIMEFLEIGNDGREKFEKINAAKTHRNMVIDRLVKRPPKVVLELSHLIKKIVGMERLGTAKLIRKVNTKETIISEVSPPLIDTINNQMQEDILILEGITGRQLRHEWNLVESLMR